MFKCSCNGMSFYQDTLVILDETPIQDSHGEWLMPALRTLYYYTCTNCDIRWLYNQSKAQFVNAAGGV